MPNPIQQSIEQQSQNLLVTGQRFKRFDQIRQRHFWSTYRLTPNPTTGYLASGDFDLFQIPVGQSGQGFPTQLTLLETNWPSANRVADNQNLEITELGVACRARIVEEDEDPQNSLYNSPNYTGAENEILRNMSLGITYLTNTVPLGMCTDFAQASGPRVGQYAPFMPDRYLVNLDDEDLTGAAYPSAARMEVVGRNLVTNGFAAPGLRRRFTIPILLQHGETFRFTLSIAAGRGPWIWPAFGNALALDLIAPVFDVRVDFWATESFVERS